MSELVGGGLVVAEAVAVAVEVEHDAAVQESVEHGGGDDVVAEDVAPGGDAAVRSNCGRDSTEIFHQVHPESAFAALPNLYVGDLRNRDGTTAKGLAASRWQTAEAKTVHQGNRLADLFGVHMIQHILKRALPGDFLQYACQYGIVH